MTQKSVFGVYFLLDIYSDEGASLTTHRSNEQATIDQTGPLESACAGHIEKQTKAPTKPGRLQQTFNILAKPFILGL